MKKPVQPAATAAVNRQFGFSAGIESDPFVFISGQVGLEADGRVPSEPGRQFELAFESLASVLEEAGLGFADLVDLTTYHVDLPDHIGKFAEVKGRFIEEPFPAWTAVGVTALVVPGLLAEIRAIARKG